jgi:hypothetical protein
MCDRCPKISETLRFRNDGAHFLSGPRAANRNRAGRSPKFAEKVLAGTAVAAASVFDLVVFEKTILVVG